MEKLTKEEKRLEWMKLNQLRTVPSNLFYGTILCCLGPGCFHDYKVHPGRGIDEEAACIDWCRRNNIKTWM